MWLCVCSKSLAQFWGTKWDRRAWENGHRGVKGHCTEVLPMLMMQYLVRVRGQRGQDMGSGYNQVSVMIWTQVRDGVLFSTTLTQTMRAPGIT